MAATEFIPFVLATLVASVVPGPAIFGVVARILSQGLAPGIVMALGLVTGDMAYFIAAVAGLSGLMAVVGELFLILKYVGAAYLLYLGWTLLTQSNDAPGNADAATDVKRRPREGWIAIYLSGLLITLGNPKTMLFFLAVLPALLDLRSVAWSDTLILGATVFVLAFGALLVYGGLAYRARVLFQSRAAVRRLNKSAGGILVVCGGALALRD